MTSGTPAYWVQLSKAVHEKLVLLSCEYAEARIESSVFTTIALSKNQIDTLSAGSAAGGSVRILKNGNWVFITFNSIRDIERFIQKGAQLSESVICAGTHFIKPSQAVTAAYCSPAIKKLHNISIEQKLSLAQSYNAILKAPSAIQNTQVTYRDTESSCFFCNTEGSAISYQKSFCGTALGAVAKDGNITERHHESHAAYGGFECAEGMHAEAERTAKIAVDLLHAEQIDGGTYTVVADQQLSGVFIHEAFGHLSEADFVYQNPGLLKVMKIGEQFGPEILTVIDDGTIDSLPGFIPADDEGIAARKNFLIKNGQLAGRLHSRETAAAMNEPLTGNARAISPAYQPIVRMTNTFIENGARSFDEMIASFDNGVYAAGYIGGQTNLEMFTFSPAYGYEIKNGKLGKMLRGMVLSGNVFSTLKNILHIGNDKKMFGGLGGCGKGGQSPLPVSLGGPHIMISHVLVGGKEHV